MARPPFEALWGCAPQAFVVSQPVVTSRGPKMRPDDPEMWQYDPHISVRLSPAQREEWQSLIKEADLARPGVDFQSR